MIDFQQNYLNDNLRDIILKKQNKKIEIIYGGNLDLYFNIFGEYDDVYGSNHFNKKITFTIDGSDQEYPLFDELINNILRDEHIDKKKELLDEETINWYSDDTYLEAANLMSIKRENGVITFTFYNNPNEIHFGIPVRVSNSGSRFEPLNVHFMNLYLSLQNENIKYDDIQRLERKYN